MEIGNPVNAMLIPNNLIDSQTENLQSLTNEQIKKIIRSHSEMVSNSWSSLEVCLNLLSKLIQRDEEFHNLTPLMAACSLGLPVLIRKLIELGENISATDSEGRNSLFYYYNSEGLTHLDFHIIKILSIEAPKELRLLKASEATSGISKINQNNFIKSWESKFLLSESGSSRSEEEVTCLNKSTNFSSEIDCSSDAEVSSLISVSSKDPQTSNMPLDPETDNAEIMQRARQLIDLSKAVS